MSNVITIENDGLTVNVSIPETPEITISEVGERGLPGADGTSGSSAWADITDKPTTFAPSAHNHIISEVTGLQASLDGKQPIGSYAASSHTHAQSDVTGLTAALAAKADSSHTHTIANVTGLQTALDGKQPSGSYAAATHTHSTSEVTGLDTALAGKAATSHSHAIADVTGLQSAIDGKAATSHTHTKSQITDFAHTHVKSDITDFAHVHPISEITSLQTFLDSKVEFYDEVATALQLLGSNIKYQTVGLNISTSATSTALTSGSVRWVAIYIHKATTLTGIGFFQKVQGVFTGSAENTLALYSMSGTTLTRQRITANDANIWKAAANTYVKVPFSGGTYDAAAGLYFVAFAYNQSAQTTAPSILHGTNATSGNINAEGKLYTSSVEASLPSTKDITTLTNNASLPWVFVY